MRALRTCDFCGADAAGAFEVVPSELEPTDAEQRRVVLCPDCRDRLETLLEPLLARAGVETATATPDEDRTDAASPSNGPISDTVGEITFEDDATDADADDDGSADAVENPVGDESTAADSSADEPTVGGSSDEPAVDDETDETGDDRPTAAAADDGSTATTADDESADGDQPTDGETGDESRPATRGTYRKVVRLLRNREFPMERAAVESLAAGAYDLEAHEVETIVDHAIERGEFAEDGGTLRRA